MEWAWRAHDGPQSDFCARQEFEVLFGGAAGPGKTDCLIMEAARYVDHPRYHAILFRRTFPQLQEIIDRCHEWYPIFRPGAYYRSTIHRWNFPSGAIIDLSHMQHETDKYNHQGKQYHFAGFDELTQFTISQYLYIFSRVRSKYSQIPKRIRSTTNPGGVSHIDVKKRFVDVCKPGKTYVDPDQFKDKKKKKRNEILTRAYIPATIYDNPSMMENDPLYISQLEALPPIEKKRLLYGDWSVFEGQVFLELAEGKHGMDRFEVPPEWTKTMIFDWGYSRPWGALWFAEDYDENLFLYRCYIAMAKGDNGEPDPNKGLRQTNVEICRKIIELEDERIDNRIADPACWGKTKLKGSNYVFGPSFYEDALGEDLFFMKADNDRLLGKQQVHGRLAPDEEIDRATGEVISEEIRFFAFLDLADWWREFENLREDPKNPEDVDTDQPDECYDMTRYMFMSRPVAPKKPVEKAIGTFQAERARYIKARNYAAKRGMSLEQAYRFVR